MALDLVFADSFAHYDDAGIPLKWSTAGGAIETDPAHVRTGPQSLRIQAGDGPTITNFRFPVHVVSNPQAYSQFTVGFAWQTTVLDGRAIFALLQAHDGGGSPLSPPQRQFFLVQNPDGSISVWTGDVTPHVLGTTNPGVITAGPFWYLELVVDMIGATLALVVTDAANIATTQLTLSGFSTSQSRVEQLEWGGPLGPDDAAWVADFYFASWDAAQPSVIGAPKIYGLSTPNEDGDPRLTLQPGVTPPPFDVTAPPFFSQVNIIPQDVSSFIARGLVAGAFYPSTVGQGFKYDVSSIPDGSTIAAIQVLFLLAEGPDQFNQVPIPGCGFIDPDTHLLNSEKSQPGIVGGPFVFNPFTFMGDPFTGDPFTLQQFVDGYQIGPNFLQEG